MSALGRSSQRVAGVLNAAFAEGLLSEETHAHRLGLLFGSGLVDQRRLIGDLRLRRGRRSRPSAAGRWRELVRKAGGLLGDGRSNASFLLALHSLQSERILVGRHPRCDIVVEDPSVSRRHAELVFRDGVWMIRDLGSTNGTTVNGGSVGRSEVRPGDVLGLAGRLIQID